MPFIPASLARPATALACAAALASLTACAGGDTNSASAQSSSATRPAAAPSGAQPNGIERKTAAEVYNLSHAANAEAGSSRQQMSRSDAESDLRVSATECAGTVSLRDTGSYDLVLKKDEAWVQPDASFAKWMNEATGEELLTAGTWYHATLENRFISSLASYCHTDQFTSPDTLDDDTTATKGPVTTLDGRRVVPVTLTGNGETVTWYAAATGEPFHVAQVSSREDMADVTYSDFGTPVKATAPSGSVQEAPTG
ncbi:hypothetical protein [Streptomyces ziwulingensis]|uniref:Lipoprotein n=1 Tax=Streptomyces ziwulingensis TaxID=1045501 RepID=A0ABP9AL21_9ACTN